MGGDDDEDGGRVSRFFYRQGGCEEERGKAMKELRKKLAALLEEVKTLTGVAEKEDRNFSDEEQTSYDEKMTAIEGLKARIERAKEQEGLDSWANEPANEAIKENPGSEEQEEIRAGARREAKKTYESFGEQMRDVIRSADHDSPNRASATERLREVRATGMSEGVPADGGFLVQTDFVSELLRRTYDTGVLPSRCRKFQISTNANKISMPAVAETSRADGSRWGGIKAYWKDEAAAKTESAPKFRKVELELNKLIGLIYLTDELLEDASMLNSFVSEGFAEEFGFKLDDAIINGSGAGQPLGILNAPALNALTPPVGQTATTITYDNVSNMRSRLYTRSWPNAVWFINQNCEVELDNMVMPAGASSVPVYLPPTGVSGSRYNTLYGAPVIPLEQCQTLGTVGDIILADLSQYILIDKGPIQSAASIHVKFTYDETCLRFVYRCDGQPWWVSTLTPFNSTDTVSPFVVMGTRA